MIGLNTGAFSIYDINTVQPIHAFKIMNSKISTSSISSNGKWIAMGSVAEKSICVWDW